MQRAEGLFQFDFSLPVHANLIVSLVNVCYFLRSTSNYALYTEAINSLSVSIKVLYAVVFALYSKKFWSQENSFTRNNLYVNLAKLTPQGSENLKIMGSDPG